MPSNSTPANEEKEEESEKIQKSPVDTPHTPNGSVSDNEENETSSTGEVTRCVCGIVESDDEASDGGLYIQCDQCSVWQHGNCVGFADESEVPEVYYCEICHPEFHKVYQRGRGAKQSKYLGNGKPIEASQTEESSSTPPSPATKKSSKQRLTMNSRDAALDYEEYLAIAKEKSLIPRRSRGRTSSKSLSPPAPQDESQGTEINLKQKIEEENDEILEDSKESKDENEENKETSTTNVAETDAPEEETVDTVEEIADEEKHSVKEESGEASPQSSQQSTITSISTTTRSTRKAKREAAAEDKADLPAAVAPKPSKTRKVGGRRGKSSSNDNHRIPQLHPDGTFVETITKPKGLHSRITMTEMRRRVASMLEYIGHIQVEMAAQSAGNQSSAKSSKEGPEEEKETLRMVDNLTRDLLHWEQRFSRT
ncbi:putative histone deacetylase complex subunit cti6 [Schizosaccharomyces pombe]